MVEDILEVVEALPRLVLFDERRDGIIGEDFVTSVVQLALELDTLGDLLHSIKMFLDP